MGGGGLALPRNHRSMLVVSEVRSRRSRFRSAPADIGPLQKCRRANPFYLLFDTAGTSIFENSFSSIFGFTTTLSITILSGGTGVSLKPSAFLPTGRTLVSK